MLKLTRIGTLLLGAENFIGLLNDEILLVFNSLFVGTNAVLLLGTTYPTQLGSLFCFTRGMHSVPSVVDRDLA